MSETLTMESVTVVSSRKRRADAITNRRTLYAAGAGLIPIPIIDIATLLGVQIVMIKDIAAVYNELPNFRRNKIKNFITALVGDFGVAGIMSGVKAIPIVGSIVGLIGAPVTAAASTYALGKVFTQHFDQGGTLLDFDPETSRDYFREEFENGKNLANDITDETNGPATSGSPSESPEAKSFQNKLLKSLDKINERLDKLESQGDNKTTGAAKTPK